MNLTNAVETEYNPFYTANPEAEFNTMEVFYKHLIELEGTAEEANQILSKVIEARQDLIKLWDHELACLEQYSAGGSYLYLDRDYRNQMNRQIIILQNCTLVAFDETTHTPIFEYDRSILNLDGGAERFNINNRGHINFR